MTASLLPNWMFPSATSEGSPTATLPAGYPTTLGLRNAIWSLHHRLLHILTSRGWARNRSGSTTLISPTRYAVNGYGRPAVYLDSVGEATKAGVQILVGGTAVASDQYAFNYRSGEIQFVGPPGGAVTANWTEWIPIVMEGWPTRERLEQVDLPVVAFTIPAETSSNYAVGTAGEWCELHIHIEILGRNSGERTDLLNDIRRNIRWLPLGDFRHYQPLTGDGLISGVFSYTGQATTRAIVQSSPIAAMPEPLPDLTRKEHFRGTINCVLKYVE